MIDRASYSQILKSSSIMGGAASITMILSMIRVKFAAILIGAAGVGLIASFNAVQGVMSVIAGLGIQSSAVRQIAAAAALGDKKAIGRSILTLRRICWLTGLFGMLVMIIFSEIIGRLTFGNNQYAFDIATLGIFILLINMSSGELAILQGMRRIADIACINILTSFFSILSAIGFYVWLGLGGIIPSIINTAIFQLILTSYFARRIPFLLVSVTWKETFDQAVGLIKLGLSFMWSGLLVSAVTFFTVALVTHELNSEAVGIYSAAFTLSGMFVNFVLAAMSVDYYPRLTGVTHDHSAMKRLVNEQTEIGLLLVMPGLIATVAMAPWIIQIFYSSEFFGSTELICWFVLGCLGRVVSFPLSFVVLALGRGRWYVFTETAFNFAHAVLILFGLQLYGLKGIAIAFFLAYCGYVFVVYMVCRYLIFFEWMKETIRTFLVLIAALATTFIIFWLLPIWQANIAGVVLTTITSIFCIRSLASRIGSDHRIVRALARLPGFKSLLT